MIAVGKKMFFFLGLFAMFLLFGAYCTVNHHTLTVIGYHYGNVSTDVIRHQRVNYSIIQNKLEKLSQLIETTRAKLLKNISTSDFAFPRCNRSNLRLADAHKPSYMNMIQNVSGVHTILYEDTIDNLSHYLAPLYYDYVSNDCPLLESMSKYGNFYGRDHYGAECRSKVREAINGHPLTGISLGVGLPDGLTFTGNTSRLITYLHIIRGAMSHRDGHVFHDDLKITPQQCGRDLAQTCPVLSESPVYDEVFTITQAWGEGFYHGTLEDLPRITPYLSFLLRNPAIKIHVSSPHKYLDLLGIKKTRLVTDKMLRARVLYMPAGGTCGRSALFTSQVLSQTLLHNLYNTTQATQDTLLLIKRSHSRWFTHHTAIRSMLQKHADRLNLTVEVFADDPLPGLNRTIEMFHRAKVIIAPHGAGESNAIFSQPDTVIIEGLCYDSDKKTNLCYRNLAQALGIRYHGLIYRHNCMTITAKQIEQALLQYI